MKNIALIVALTFFLAACSSGTTVSDNPINLTGLFTGTYESQNGEDRGEITINLAQPQDATTLSGTVSVQPDTFECLSNGAISMGSISGFSVTITADLALGDATFQLTFDNANTLTGTYIANGCSNATGSGTVTLTR